MFSTFWQRLRVQGNKIARQRRRSNRVEGRLGLEVMSLEDRILPSNLVWANRGQTSDRFTEVFGANAEAARRVTDAVLNAWSTVLDQLNFPDRAAPNRYELTVSMKADGVGHGGSGGGGYGGDGFPTNGSVTMDRGNDVNGDGKGDGAGWFIDPTPGDNVEFTQMINPFAARATPITDAARGSDFYGVMNSEIYHALGFISLAPGGQIQTKLQNPLRGRVVDTGIKDRDSNVGNYFVFDGPSITAQLTAFDSGAGDSRAPVHTAGPTRPRPDEAIPFNSQFRGEVQLTGGVDAGNAVGEGGVRVLVSDVLALIFKDAYGHTIKLPSSLPNGTFNAQRNQTTGVVMVRGGVGDSSDKIQLRRDGNDLVVSVDAGFDGPVLDDNADNNLPPFVTRIPMNSIQSIQVEGGGGDDDVVLDFSGGNFIPTGGLVEEGGDGTDEVTIVGSGTFMLNGNTLKVPGGGKITLNGDEKVDLTGGSGADIFNVRNFVGTVNLNGAGGNDIYNISLRGSGQSTVNITDASGTGDRLNVTGTARDDSFTVDGASLQLGTGTETINYDESEIETLSINTGLGNDVVTVDGFLGTTMLLIDAGPGNDSVDASGFLGIATIKGGAGDDILIGGQGNDVLQGGFGNDHLEGGAGNDSLNGGSGNDELEGNEGNDKLSGGAGNDELDGGAGHDLLDGGLGNDFLYADDDESDTVIGGRGLDHCQHDRHDKVSGCES